MKSGASACVVLASGGFGKFVLGKKIAGLTDADRVNGVQVFHAGRCGKANRL